MDSVYKARYYDGHSSMPKTVVISITENGLHITFSNPDGMISSSEWKKAQTRETEFNSSILILQYGESFPYEQLEITDKEFHREYTARRGASLIKRLRTNQGMMLVITGLLTIVAAIALIYIYLLPWAVDIAAKRVPQAYEIEMGKSLYENILKNEKVDTAKTIAINQFFGQIQVEGNYPVHISVVKQDIPNAFALPGGSIVVYSKILEDMETPEQLAALLAHEYSHVQLKHSTRNIFRSLAGSLVISIIIGDFSGATALIVQNAENLRSLSYSRTLENEADNDGLQILKANGINASGMKALFEQLKKASDIEILEIVSTHPDLDKRIINVETFIEDNPYDVVKNDSLTYYFKTLTADEE
ncbi:MAG: M48 family metallopeptidase [Bacteroidota bacterium]